MIKKYWRRRRVKQILSAVRFLRLTPLEPFWSPSYVSSSRVKALVSSKPAAFDFCYSNDASIIGLKLLWSWLEVCKLLLVGTERKANFFSLDSKDRKHHYHQDYLTKLELNFSLITWYRVLDLFLCCLVPMAKKTLLIRTRSIRNRYSNLIFEG